ncbi:hypothetical protein [Halpernia sp.]|uniref:hypothetical protein n=1 Tax=Halpernia sp. TaxID=2782209 RepID=UPI003A93825C
MKNKYFRIFSISFGSLLLILILANFGINFWLKHNLPDYLKNNTSYKITYQNLDVELLSGTISAQGISINNANPTQNKILGLQGTVDSLQISRLGIYDAVFNKRINTKNLVLVKPLLNITLPIKSKNKEQNPIEIKNIEIKEGNIQVFKPNKNKLLRLNSLNLKIKGLELSPETDTNNLPFEFDAYSFEAKNIFFRPDSVYLFLAEHIKTENGYLNIRKFSFVPLLSYSQFIKYFPTRKNLYNLKSSEAVLEGLSFKNKKINIKTFRVEEPNLKIYTTNVKPEKEKKEFKYNIFLENLILNNAKVDIQKPNQTPLFIGENLNLNINKITINKETEIENIPFQYEDFKIDGKNLDYFTNSENIKIASAKINPKSIFLSSTFLKTTSNSTKKNNFDLNTKSILIKMQDFKMVNSKLKLEINEILIDQMNGKIATANVKFKQKNKSSFIDFPLKIHKINLKNSNLNIDSKGKPMVLNGLNLNINELELNQNKDNQLLLDSKNYQFSAKRFNYQPSQFYKIVSNNISISQDKGQISNFAMTPLVTRAQFIKMIPTEKDLYNLKAENISFNGKYDLLNQNKFVNLSQVTLNKVDANIFRSKIPKDDETVKSLYSKMLRSIKIPLFVDNLDVKNSVLVYEEDIPTSDGPGKISFNPFNMNVKNINSAKMKGKPTQVAITINAGFMESSPLHVNWGFNTADLRDHFTISGSLKNLPAPKINPFIEPYLHLSATGNIKQLLFDFKGNPVEINGNFKMQHDNLKVSILKKNSKEKNKFLSGIANLFIKNDSGKFPESVTVDHVKRDNTKSFFNLFWKGLEEGLKKTLLGVNYKKTEEKVQKTVTTAKETVKDVKTVVVKAKDDVKAVKEKAVEKLKPKPEKAKKKKGFFERIFN